MADDNRISSSRARTAVMPLAAECDDVGVTGREWLWYAAWLAVGALSAIAILDSLTFGVLVLPVAVAATIVLARSPRSLHGLPGVLAGASLPLLYIAFLNRDGPGDVCYRNAHGGSCTQEWSPWPFLLVAAALVAVSVLLARRPKRATSTG